MSSTRTRERRIAERLRAVRPPGEGDALERALELAEELSIPGAAPLVRPSRRRGLMALAGALLAAALLTLTPAGATVTNWIGDAVDSALPPAPPCEPFPPADRSWSSPRRAHGSSKPTAPAACSATTGPPPGRRGACTRR